MTIVAATGLQNIFPVLRYKDANAAIEWLNRVFGTEELQIIRNPDGTIAHGELKFGSGVVMINSARDDHFGSKTPTHSNSVSQLNYVVLADTDAHFERAKAEGADIVVDLHSTEYGSRDYTARDLEGNVWCFGTYSPFCEQQPTFSAGV
jgi:uncharacterized glyoxalase superfamily protein PhnB